MDLQDLNNNPFTEALAPKVPAKATGLKRLLSLGVRGATLGLAGAPEPPETIGETASEFVGSIVPIAAISSAVSPVAGAGLRAIRLPANAIASRVAGAGATGAITGAIGGAVSGENPFIEAGKEAGLFISAEGAFLGAGRALSKLRGTKVLSPAEAMTPEHKAAANAAIQTATLKAPEKPPVPVIPTQTEFGFAPQATQRQLEFPPAPSVRGKKVPTLDEIRESIYPGSAVKRELEVEKEFQEGLPKIVKKYEEPLIAKAMERQQAELLFLHFNQTLDTETGLPLLTPKTPQVVDAIKKAEVMPQHQLELPLGPEQIGFLNRTDGIALRNILDVNKQREPFLASNVLKNTPEQVEQIVEDATKVPVSKIVSMDLSDDAITTKMLMEKAGLTDNNARRILKASETFKAGADRANAILKQLEELCKNAL